MKKGGKRNNHHYNSHYNSNKNDIRTTKDIIETNEHYFSQQRKQQEREQEKEDEDYDYSDGDGGDDYNENDESNKVDQFNISLYMWEFGQNDPKRDSGSKLRRLGYANLLKIGQTFKGVVLSSEASEYVSMEDRNIVETFGIAGINCSWNRLNEIPFDSMGKGKNQRLLPLLYAANSVNYGKPHKLNTAEAMAACLYLTGFITEAHQLLSPFGYGEEFFRINFEAFSEYQKCSNSREVLQMQQRFIEAQESNKRDKLNRKEKVREGCMVVNSYLADMDLPPQDDDDDEYGYGYESGEYDNDNNNDDSNENNNNDTNDNYIR